MKTAEISDIKPSMLGTTVFNMKAGRMRKPQKFVIYPIKENDNAKKIKVQSDSYIGIIDLKEGKGVISGPHSHPGFMQLQTDIDNNDNQKIELKNIDNQSLKMQVFTSADKEAGQTSAVKTDNSGAINVLDI